MVFLGMPVLPQVPVLVQLWVQAGGREGCSHAQGQHHNGKHPDLQLENSDQTVKKGGAFSENKRVKSGKQDALMGLVMQPEQNVHSHDSPAGISRDAAKHIPGATLNNARPRWPLFYAITV